LFNEDISQLSKFSKSNEKIIWRQWSGDTFNILKETIRFRYFDINSQFIKSTKLNSMPTKAIIILYNFLIKSMIWSKSAIKNHQIKNALSKIDMVANWNDFETKQIKTFYPSFKAKYFQSVYIKPDIAKVKKPLLVKESNEVLNIFLGHNGYPDVNYKEIIDFLDKIKNNYSFNVTCVLSYGDKEYISFILKYGKEKLGERFKPLVNFMDMDEYYAMFDSFNVFIFNSSLQTGAGNIYQALKMGKKVFLRSENPIFQYLNQRGLVIFPIHVLLKNSALLTKKISYENMYNNFKILTSLKIQEQFDKEMSIFY